MLKVNSCPVVGLCHFFRNNKVNTTYLSKDGFYMRKCLSVLPLLCALLLLCACAAPSHSGTENSPEQSSPSEPGTSSPSHSQSDTPQHSPLYIPDVSPDEILLYFNEVCLDAEIGNGGDFTKLQKWASPIYYCIHGDYTAEDMAVFTSFAGWLNTVDGFPGIYEASTADQSNLNIYFCSISEMVSRMGDWTYGLDGAVTFWYTNHEIDNAIICYRSDIDQQIRNSVILEEIYNGLGPIQDTSRRVDSIIYSGYSTPQSLTAIDELLLRLLYHPQLTCGMDSAQCETVIRQLYY